MSQHRRHAVESSIYRLTCAYRGSPGHDPFHKPPRPIYGMRCYDNKNRLVDKKIHWKIIESRCTIYTVDLITGCMYLYGNHVSFGIRGHALLARISWEWAACPGQSARRRMPCALFTAKCKLQRLYLTGFQPVLSITINVFIRCAWSDTGIATVWH